MNDDCKLFIDLKHASRNFPSGNASVFGKFRVNDGETSTDVYSRVDLSFYREFFSFGYRGKRLGTMATPFSFRFNITEDNIMPLQTKTAVLEARLVNPFINSKTNDLFYVTYSPFASIYMKDGKIRGFELEEPAEIFTNFYITLLESKEGLVEKDKQFTKLRRHMRVLERKARRAKSSETWEEETRRLSNAQKAVLMRLLGV